MAKHRDALPQLGDDRFLSDGGIETTLSGCRDTDHRHVDAIFRDCRSR
jgi:hypothetical protein